MNLPVPLAVLLRNPKTGAHRDITRDLRDLSYRSVIPGGFASARLSLNRPLDLQPDEIDYYVDVTAYDRLTGEIEWQGWLEDPSRQVNSAGQVWNLTAIGGAGHAGERTVPAVWVDRDISHLYTSEAVSAPGADARIGGDPGGTGQQSVLLRFPSGLPINSGSKALMFYDRIMRAGQRLALFDYGWNAGVTAPDLFVEGVASTDGIADTVARSEAANTAGGGFSARRVGTHFSSLRNSVKLQMRWNDGAATVVTDNFWSSLFGFVAVARRKDKAGVDISSGASYMPNVVASEVVADLLGWLLTRYDGPNAFVQASTYEILQLAYPDGVMPAAVLADLMKFEPDFYWAAWERNATSGKYRFEWRSWPTTVRYDASIGYGFDGPASAGGLYNGVSVRYRTDAGHIHVTRYTAPVPALDAAGVIRDAFIDLGDEAGGQAAADRVGPEFLAQHSTPPNAGRLTVYGPIYDALRGRMVPPWKIRPGGLIRARGVQPRTDSLNPTGRDGATIFKVVGTEFIASRAATVLDLDSAPLSVAASVADQRRTAGRRRR